MTIWAVGRNYADHAKELGNAVPSEPFIFIKAGGTLVANESVFTLPAFSNDVHHECEIAFRFDSRLELSEMTLALDLTARDAQAKAKAAGLPWSLAKSFKQSCPIGPFVNVAADLRNIQFTLKVNGEIRQTGHSKDMIFDVAALKAFVLSRFPVEPGDLLLTGTPAGVSALKEGDRLEAEIPGVLKARWSVAGSGKSKLED